MENPFQKTCYTGALVSLAALIILCLAWELALAPLRPGGSWLALKALPLLLPLRGILKRDVYTLQWSSMFILVYFAEGIVRGFSDKSNTSTTLAWIEAALSCIFFLGTIFYLKPYKKAAKKLAQQAIQKAAE